MHCSGGGDGSSLHSVCRDYTLILVTINANSGGAKAEVCPRGARLLGGLLHKGSSSSLEKKMSGPDNLTIIITWVEVISVEKTCI